ncbi:anhydro-N-acetylmuramic acid kinase [Rhodovibrio sodomensis]|uniref:Anhydro-N-acetylmuramic acid kinase n=2 Tax=Rhodovibrio sodomensis TaxID=1088 RepID=A0ABS1DET1_9PROT|nr:anhydro-N-acetylmuramic acid kinase [Rhodovibrio sodomensis]
MSGTSRDGIDAALLETDGQTFVRAGAWHSAAYPEAFRQRLADAIAGRGDMDTVERELTDRHAAAVDALLAKAGVPVRAVRAIGFHGHTVAHDPAIRMTRQIGDSGRLARQTGIDVVGDFRLADVAAGGQGAPFAPYYHRARATGLDRPLAVLNLGGVGNVTWLGRRFHEILAFDTGPGNALLDDLVAARTGRGYDRDGELSATGQVDRAALAAMLAHPFFDRAPPKSLDRDDFTGAAVADLADADAAATLAAFTAESVARACGQLPERPVGWLVTGGGRHNPTLMRMLAARLDAPVEPVEAVGWDGDALEAQAFAYLAVRSLQGLPLSGPTTTGVPNEMPGGKLYAARNAR